MVATDSNNCTDNAITNSAFEVVALPNITVDANVTTDFTNCDSAFDYSTAVSPSGGVWSGGPFISSTGSFDPNGLAADTYTITYTAGVLPCTSTTDINIDVTGGAVVALTQNTLDICETTNLNLTDYVASGNGSWTDENNLPIDDSVPYNLPDINAPTDINIPSTPTSIELTFTSDDAACGNSETLTVNVFPYPDASTIAPTFDLCNTNSTGGNASIDLDDLSLIHI